MVLLDDRLIEWGLPAPANAMAAGIDLRACIDAPLELIAGHPATLVPTGFAMHIKDPGLVGLIVPRSGLGHKAGIVMGNGTGVIDCDFQGQLMVSLWNRNGPGTSPLKINPGDRIAQLILVPVVLAAFQRVAAFSESTERGEGGFGSTGR
jgi:dUTP pyrophosphatase